MPSLDGIWTWFLKRMERLPLPAGSRFRAEQPSDLQVWRARAFYVVFLSIVVLGLPAYLASVYFLALKAQWAPVAIYSFCYFLMIGLILLTQVDYRIRALIGSAMFLLVGLVNFHVLGAYGSGKILLFFFPLLACLVLGTRYGLLALLVDLIILIAYTNFIYELWPSWQGLVDSYDLVKGWIVTSFVMMLLCGVAMIAVSVLVKGLEGSLGRYQVLERELQADIRARERTQRALTVSEEKFKALFEKAPFSYQSLDERGCFREVNQTWLTTMGYDREEVIGQRFLEFVGDKGREQFNLHFDRLLNTGESREAEFEMVKKDGSLIRISCCSRIGYSLEDAVIRTHCVLQDVTGQRKAEEENKRLEAQLRQAQKMEALGTLAGGIAHDFNNILAVIVGFSELAYEDAKEGICDPQEIKEILGAAQRAKDLVRQILTFGRKAEAQLSVLDLNREIDRTVKLLRSTLPKMIRIEFEGSSLIGVLRGDTVQLEQLLMNLATNAADAMPSGGLIRIATDLEQVSRTTCSGCGKPFTGNYATITVSDTGEGMDEKLMERIFEPFFTTKEVGKGTGLGLSTVFGIVTGHGGHITCDSRPGQGTTFKIYLPALEEGSGENLEAAARDRVGEGKGETILLVDDEEQVRMMYRETFSRRGYQVLLAADGEEALAAFEELKDEIDLVVLDIGMPGMGGYKCFKRLRRIDPAVKILIASGYSGDVELKDLLSSGAAGFLAKPFDRAALLQSMRRILDGD